MPWKKCCPQMLLAIPLFSCNADKVTNDIDTSALEETGTLDTDIDETGTIEDVYAYSVPNLGICDDVAETDFGSLCAIQPSRLDENARDQFGDDSPEDRTLGFGYHVVAFPKAESDIKGIYIHFTGSMGRAYNQRNATFPSSTILDEAMQAGFITIQIAYHNRYAVNSPSECIGSNNVNNCAGDVRREKITGEDVSSVVDVPVADSITHRMTTVVTYLEEQEFVFPVSILEGDSVQWSNLMVGGHSQGAGHALYITKYWDSAQTCLFGGPYDVPDTVPTASETIADWYLDGSVTVDIATVRALLSLDDNNYDNFIQAYNVLEMTEGTHWQSFQAAEYRDADGEPISGHGAVIHDPAFYQERYETCFKYGQ